MHQHTTFATLQAAKYAERSSCLLWDTVQMQESLYLEAALSFFQQLKAASRYGDSCICTVSQSRQEPIEAC